MATNGEAHVRILCIWYDRAAGQDAGGSQSPPKKAQEKMTAEELREWYAERAAVILESSKARQVSPEFDAPQFCRDWIELAQKTVKNNGLRVMVRQPKPDGKPNKRTGKIPMTWLPYSQ